MTPAPSPSAPDPPTTPDAPRHQQRERALSLLYEAEMKGERPLQVLDELAVPPDPYVRVLLEHVEERAPEVDRRIAAVAEHWPLDRMAVVDRLVMRLAVAELLDPQGPPVAVVIDEAVELAKVYSTEESGGFVNGILSAVAADVRGGPETRTPTGAETGPETGPESPPAR